jgi:uncharacterized membrane protein (UPF0127 family)
MQVLVVILAAILIVLFLFVQHTKAPGRKYAELTLNSKKLHAEVADTPALRELGLSYRDKLGADAMIFVYPEPYKACFWMKGMRFNLDMLWFDNDKHLVGRKDDVAPSTYPNSFCPPVLAKYVLELPAGETAKLGIGPQTVFQASGL